jgi:pantothenate kinase
VRAELDEVWFLDVPDAVRRPRLVARHAAYGKTPAEAEAWVSRVDDANASLVLAARSRADRWVDPDDADASQRPGLRDHRP